MVKFACRGSNPRSLGRSHAEEGYRDIVIVHEEVNIGPAVRDGIRGFSVRRELVYPQL